MMIKTLVGLHVNVRVDFLKVIILLTVKLRIPIVAKLTQRNATRCEGDTFNKLCKRARFESDMWKHWVFPKK